MAEQPESTNRLEFAQQRIDTIHQTVINILITQGVRNNCFGTNGILPQSILYMIYWHRRLGHLPQETQRILEHLAEYIGPCSQNEFELARLLVRNDELAGIAKDYVENLLAAQRTVDLVILDPNAPGRNVLCTQRSYFPFGLALPGGFVLDTDEDNSLAVSVELAAAFRVAGMKILGLDEAQALVSENKDDQGQTYYLVQHPRYPRAVKIYPEGRFRYNEGPNSIFRLSDPRHIVDTTAFQAELVGEIDTRKFVWRSYEHIMDPDIFQGGFAFGHHAEIVAHLANRPPEARANMGKERDFIRSLINNPKQAYLEFRDRLNESPNPELASVPEFAPIVDRMLKALYSDKINRVCEEVPVFAGIRDEAVITLRHVALGNRDLFPYRPTVEALFKGVCVFDMVERHKREFYRQVPKKRIIEHNPREQQNALYHSYRYTYRYNRLLAHLDQMMVVPTFEPLSATDLLKVRGVPIFFLGLSTEFIYVDEFEQSPKEFFMHDVNHCYRMWQENVAYMEKTGMTEDELIEASCAFIDEYLPRIKVLRGEHEEGRELKKLKKIILFEIVHEDARPFMRDVIGEYIQQIEGGRVPFEVPMIEPNGWYMNIVDKLDLGIPTLSYVRNKLQHGFYDEVDAQLPQIVGPAFRTARWIARAAYEMLVELNIPPADQAELNKKGRVSLEWLLKRTCAVGPDNIHPSTYIDPDVDELGDGAHVNTKTYQVTLGSDGQ